MSDFKQFGNPIGKGTAYTLELLTPYERKLGVIPAVLNYQYRNKVMGLNEIEFDIPAYFIIDQKDVAHPFYHIVDNGMLIQVHISGQKEPLQYIVDTVNESTDKSTEAQKHIHAFSKEYFLSRKKFLGMELAGRILYYTPDLPERYRVDGDGLPRGVLNDIFEKHGIEVTHIDESLKRKAREISIGSTNIYQFLAHLEETFGCIFKFNGDATKVGIYDSSSFGRDTGITISERNIINTFSEDTRYEDMVTRLYVYGSDEISIASVNPTGLPYIDDFSYFFKENYLPKYLIDLYNEFAKLPKHNTELNSLVVQRNELLTKRNEAEFYLEVVRDELRQALHWAEALELREKNNTDYVGSDPKYEDSNAWNALKSSAEVKEFINAVKSNTTLTDRSFTSKNITFVSLLELSRSTDEELQKLFKDDLETLQARGGEAGWLAEIDRLKQSYDTINENIKSLQRNNDFNQYMAEHLTAEQFAEGKKALDAVTIEGEYINSDLDSSMLNELLEEGKKELDKMCFPKIQFTVDALDFSQLFDTQDLWNYLLLGDIIYVKTDTGFNYPVHFIGIEHSPDTASLNLQFSSSAALTDSAIFLADLIANATRANGILSMNKDTWNKAATEASAINQQLKEGFDLAQQRLAGASKQVPILDERGFWLYALDSNENPKPEQIRAINNVIALTKDGWETIEVAITPEGINANAIVVGTMSADRIRLGRFESADKTTYWDLETNEIKIGDTFFFSPETGLEIDFQPPAKHKNLISTAEFFTEYSVSMPESARHRFETNATTGELRLIAPREDGTYDFYLAVDSAALTQNFTLLSDNLDMINDIVPKVTVALANSNYDLYSSPVTITKGSGTYTITPTISSAELPLSFLRISLTKENTTSEVGIVIPPETLALVKEWVPDLTWQDTVISGVSSSTVINNERIGMTIENNIENKLAALDITEDGIAQRVSSSTKEYFDLNKDQLKGADGNTPYVEDGYWFINGTNTGIKAEGQDGAKGAPGTPGEDGISSHIWIRYYSGDLHPWDEWDFSKFTVFPTESTKWIGTMIADYEDTEKIDDFSIEMFQWIKYVGLDGKDGATPYIGSNGNWWIDGIDTGVEADVAPIREEFESYRTQTDKAIADRVTKTEYSGLTTRVAQAEQKLTPTSITQTVENNTTTLATKAEVQTTAENWTAKFSQIGGKNLLYASNVPVSTTSRLITSYDMEEEWQPNTEYTVTIKGSLEGTGTRKWGILGVAISGAHSSGETSFTFVTPSSFSISNLKTLQLYNHPSASAGASTVEWIKLEKGSISTGYDQHPSELYTGITTVNKDGVTVGREDETIETNLGFDGVRIKDGTTEIASFTGSGAVINNLEAESISGDVINIMSNSMTFDVGSGTGYYADFSEVLNAIGNRKHLASGVKITINIRSVLKETISIEGFSGSGSIEVNIYSRVNGNIRTSSNSCAIMVYGKNTTHVVSYSGYPVISKSDAYVLFDGLNIDSKNTTDSRSILSEQGSNVYVRNCDMINCQDALGTATAGKIHAVDNRGNPSRWAAVGYQGSIWLGGTIPDGGNSWFVYTFGNVKRTPSSFSPPPTKTVTETRTFNHTDIYTYSVKHGAKSTHYGKAAAQNRWDTSMTQMKGRIVFGSSVYSFIAGRNSGTTPTVKIRLRRQNSSHGASASVKPTPDWSGAPSFGGATRGNWTPWVTIPYTLFTSNGYTFSFYNGTTGNSYAIWDRAEIQITRTVTQ